MILPAYNKQLTIIKNNGITGDIINTLNQSFADAVKATKEFSKQFKSENLYDSAFEIWYFVRNKINYVKDPAGKQIIQLPQALVRRGLKINGNKQGGDCKSMALLVASTMYNLGAQNVRLRYAGYFGDEPTHVYAVASINGRDVPIDPVISKFDYEKPYKFKKDYKMNVYQLSGIGATYDEKLNILKNKLKPGTIHFLLVSKEILKQSGKLTPEAVNPVQQQSYLARLNRLKVMHEKLGKTGLLYKLVLNEINDVNSGIVYGGISGIGKLNLKKAFKNLKKVSLAPSRVAFLGLVEINVKGLATKLKKLPRTKVAKMWEKFGGNVDKLYKSIERGAKRKKLGNVDDYNIGIGNPAAAVAAAAPVILAVVKLFAGSPTPKVDENGQPILDAKGQPIMEQGEGFLGKIKSFAPGLLEKGLDAAKEYVKIDDKGEVDIKENVEITDKQPSTFGGINKNILIFGGAGLVALLLLRKK